MKDERSGALERSNRDFLSMGFYPRVFFRFDSLNVDLDEGEREGHDQRARNQPDHPEGLDAAQNREEEKKRMDVCSRADE